jgi:hypothetical protein
MMQVSRADPADDPLLLPRLPGWITSCPMRNPEEAAFCSGAALAHVQMVLRHPSVPQFLLRDRLSLTAAQFCLDASGARLGHRYTKGPGDPSTQSGKITDGDGLLHLRDAVHLTRQQDHPGPIGVVVRQWSQAVARNISAANLSRALIGWSDAQISHALGVKDAHPVARAAGVIEAMRLGADPFNPGVLVMADAVLAKALHQSYVLPIISIGLKPRDLNLHGDDLRLACHAAVVAGAGQVVALSAQLVRKSMLLQAITPKLRAKQAARAIEVFLSHDAVLPAMLTPFMSDRAARRLCERLVNFGVVRELTGRNIFRLYGV